ncbi:hypothetical protein LSTR_LSTR011405 [Laodelphax striatellus]|uniref:Uncharacterized protein n=1 Tax=Laodelphax striatellus TaxID=195883 RepID=A0A482WVP7_LAOST|nr:hypothetical protein LSTR_LSTR011405 [Laodelphax striatellus]
MELKKTKKPQIHKDVESCSKSSSPQRSNITCTLQKGTQHLLVTAWGTTEEGDKNEEKGDRGWKRVNNKEGVNEEAERNDVKILAGRRNQIRDWLSLEEEMLRQQSVLVGDVDDILQVLDKQKNVLRELEQKKPQLDELVHTAENLKADSNRQQLHGKALKFFSFLSRLHPLHVVESS